VAITLLAGCATFPVAGDEGGPPWIRVNTPHFSLATDMKPEPAEELAHMLEDWWAAMSVALASTAGQSVRAAKPQTEPLLVIALRSQGEREAVHYRLGGVFTSFSLVPPAMSIGNIDEAGGREVLKHELAHALLHQRLPRIPRWLTEGMAVYLQTAALDRDRQIALWGTRSISETHNVMEYGAHISTKSLLDPKRWAGMDAGLMEFRAGLLVHMLINQYPDALTCYLDRLEADLDLDGALSCFGSRQNWDFELDDYAYSVSFPERQTRYEASDAEARTTPMNDADTHAVLALLDFMVVSTIEPDFRPPRIERARHNVDRALALDPTNPLAAMLLLAGGEVDAARWDGLTRAMVTSNDGDWRAWVARARTPNLPGIELQQATARARALAPEETEVLRLTAFDALRRQQWAEARTLGIKAWLGGATDDFDRATLFVASAQLGHCEEALNWARSPAETKKLNETLLSIQAQLDQPRRPCDGAPADLQ